MVKQKDYMDKEAIMARQKRKKLAYFRNYLKA